MLIGSSGLNNSSVSGQAVQITGTTRPTLIFRGDSSGSQVAEIQFADNSGGDSDSGVRAGLIQYDHHGGNFMAFHANSAERMRIASDGNVAIGGTPDSAFRLCVNGDGSSEIGAIQFRNASAGGNTFTAGMFSATSTSALLNVVGAGNLVIKTNNTERMRIDSSGNLGLGATSVDSDIHIEKSSDIAIKLERTNSGVSTISVPSSGELHINNTSNADMVFSTNNTEAMRIQQDGTLSVGVTGDTDAKIYASRGDAGNTVFFESSSSATSGVKAISTSLNQNANNSNCQHLRATTQNISTFRLDGNGTSTFSSDERLKKNIETTRDGYLEDLAKLRVVKYNWHDADVSTDKELGLIAQEVQKVFPKLVVEDDEELNGIEKPLALKVSVLPMMLLKALQEANTKITALESKVTTLEGA